MEASDVCTARCVVVVLPSLSPLAAAVVSVESQLSCPVASLGPTVAAVPAAEVLEAGAVLLAGSVGSDSDVVFVHWRAFFYRV